MILINALRFLTLFSMLFFSTIAFSQEIEEEKPKANAATLFSVEYSVQLPRADLADRFGINSSMGSSLLFKTRTNFLYGVSGHFIFGNVIKEDSLLGNIATRDGQIIGVDGLYAPIEFFERGFVLMGRLGKLFPLQQKNLNSGLLVTVGAGFLQHKIRIEDDKLAAPQIRGEYSKGYDRLTNGFALNEFIGFQHLDQNGQVNFLIGLECTQGFTKHRRSLFFDTKTSDNSLRLDLLVGLKVGWILPLYSKKEETDKYFTN